MNIRSYSKPFNFGHKAVQDLFTGKVFVQEKIDGSQISFRRNEDGTVEARSRKASLFVSQDDKSMFRHASRAILTQYDKLTPGYTYRGEYLMKPKHNTIAYDRIPENHIIIFDIDRGDQDYMDMEEMAEEAFHAGFESVPLIAWIKNETPTMEHIKAMLNKHSCLGEVLIEGIVFKNYAQYDEGGRVLMAKYVSPEFREKHSGDWKKRNPTQSDIVGLLVNEYRTDARWRKAIQHMQEEGKLEGIVQDIPIVIKEVQADIKAECEEEIKEKLFKFFWQQISRRVIHGLPEFYKEYLLERALSDGHHNNEND
jgi:hypothetical protein